MDFLISPTVYFSIDVFLIFGLDWTFFARKLHWTVDTFRFTLADPTTLDITV